MIKPRRKTLLAANVILPGLIVLAYDCPLITGYAPPLSGNGFDAGWSVVDGGQSHFTWAQYIGVKKELLGWIESDDCSHVNVVDEFSGWVETTAMVRFETWSNSSTSFGMSAVVGKSGGGALAAARGA
jgi:hypothetical protein